MEPFHLIKIVTEGAELAVRLYNGDSRESIILLHGGPGLDDYLASVAQFLAPTYQVVSYDQRGAGQSSHHGPYGIKDHVNDLEILRQHLGVERIHLFGHSWGGLLAQLYAKSYPQYVASLVLCSSAAGLGWDFKAENREAVRGILLRRPWLLPILNILTLLNLFSFGLMFGAIGRLTAPAYFFHPHRVSEDDLSILSHGRYSAFMGTMRSIQYARAGQLKRIDLRTDVSVLRLRGKHDLFRGPESFLHTRFPRSQEVRFEESGHFPWLEEPEQFRSTLTTFYRKVVPTF